MKKDYDELETYNHNNDSYNEYGGQARMTYDDLVILYPPLNNIILIIILIITSTI